MSLYDNFKTDNSLEKTGIILNYGLNSRGENIDIKIARAGGANDRYNKRIDILFKPYRHQMQTGVMDANLQRKLVRDAYAESVVLGWSGVEVPVLDENGNRTGQLQDLPFSVENCKKLFEDLPDLFADILAQAQSFANFKRDVQEVDAKN